MEQDKIADISLIHDINNLDSNHVAATAKKVMSDEWVPMPNNAYIASCCDCGLTHILEIKEINGVLHQKFVRDDIITAAIRKAHVFPL